MQFANCVAPCHSFVFTAIICFETFSAAEVMISLSLFLNFEKKLASFSYKENIVFEEDIFPNI